MRQSVHADSRPLMRYAIYAAPSPDTPLHRTGSALLGYDAVRGIPVPFPDDPVFQSDRWRTLTEAARRYGFHATLKAPFEPAAGVTEATVITEVERLADRLAATTAGPLQISTRRGFIALRPAPDADDRLRHLAQTCVEALDHVRAPLSAADRARRLAAPLTARQIAQLDRWGYPYVGQDFEFHMTLSDTIAAPERDDLAARLHDRCPELTAELPIDALVVFRQPMRSAPFTVAARIALATMRAHKDCVDLDKKTTGRTK